MTIRIPKTDTESLATNYPEKKWSYWASFELKNGMVGTWCDDADTTDEFIELTIQREYNRYGGHYIKKFTEIHEHSNGEFGGVKKSIAKYNKMLKELK